MRGIATEGSQQKLTARRNREGKGLRWTKQTGEKRESGGGEGGGEGGLIGQRQTERQDLPLSFQRERKQTASAERRRQSQGQLGRKKKGKGSKFITRNSSGVMFYISINSLLMDRCLAGIIIYLVFSTALPIIHHLIVISSFSHKSFEKPCYVPARS